MDFKKGMTVVIPFLNESDGIELCCQMLEEKATNLDFPLEAIFVDDGSFDDTLEKLTRFPFHNLCRVEIIKLSKNYGSHAAIRAGVMHATMDICTWMGSDLQEPDDFLKVGYEEICRGNDAVYFEKNTIKVSKFNRAFSLLYSSMMRKYAVPSYSSGGISNIVFNRRLIDYLNENVESNSSVMLQIMNAGFQYTMVSMDYKERSSGVSKWTLAKKIKLFIDSFVSFSFMPIRLVSFIGVVIFLIGVVIGVATTVNRFLNPSVPAGYSTLASIMALGFGITNISLGIIAEYLWRAYDAARKRPVFLISDVIELKQGDL